MQNLLAQAEYVIESAIYSPSGDGKIPYIAANDVAAVALVTLTQPGHAGKKYVLTGPEAISYRQAARSSAPSSASTCGLSMSRPSKRRAAFEKACPPSSKACRDRCLSARRRKPSRSPRPPALKQPHAEPEGFRPTWNST
jgi:nucleoside-diphosphate-sugar epimerase